MTQHHWPSESRKYMVYVDSYEDAVLKGRILCPHWETEVFSSLIQFLLKMEELLDHVQCPQAFTELRKFSSWVSPGIPKPVPPCGKGAKLTFELRVIFRQHSSWQGVLIWKEKQLQHNFRSVLELVILMDSALRSTERSGCA